MFRILFSKWVLIPLILVVVFFGFAYWRGYSPMDVLARIQQLLPGGGAPAPTTTAPATTVVEHKENPIVSAGKQALQATRPARSQIWDMFEYKVGFGTYKFPIWTWVVFILLVAVVVLPLVWWGSRKILDRAGITLQRPTDPRTFAMQGVAVLAILTVLTEVYRRYGIVAGLGVTAAGIGEFLVITQGWGKLPDNIREIGRTPIADILELVVQVLRLIVAIALLVVGTAVPLMTAGSFLAPGQVTTTKLQGFTTSLSQAVPSPINILTNIVSGALGLAISILNLVSFGYNQLALVAMTALTILLFVAGGRRGRTLPR